MRRRISYVLMCTKGGQKDSGGAGLMTEGQNTPTSSRLGTMGCFWRKYWLWAKVALGGAARIWVYLNSCDLIFFFCL